MKLRHTILNGESKPCLRKWTGFYLRSNRSGEYENVAILAAIAVNEDGCREVLGAAEGMKEDITSKYNRHFIDEENGSPLI